MFLFLKSVALDSIIHHFLKELHSIVQFAAVKNGTFRESDSDVREHRVQWICKNEIHRKACIMSTAEKQVRLKR